MSYEKLSFQTRSKVSIAKESLIPRCNQFQTVGFRLTRSFSIQFGSAALIMPRIGSTVYYEQLQQRNDTQSVCPVSQLGSKQLQ